MCNSNVRRTESEMKGLGSLLEFSVKSLPRTYGRVFLRHVVLRHPLRALHGLYAYCRVVTASSRKERLLFCGDQHTFVQRAAADGDRLLLGTGFCQKPVRAASPNRGRNADRAGGALGCPAGRYSHDCLYLSDLELDSGRDAHFHPACADCFIRLLGYRALRAGASFAILTSALDIATDILLPALEMRRFTHVLLAICPYSIEPMSLALLACGMEGYLFPYHTGACANYSQWVRADGGDKPERTRLSPQTTTRLTDLLEAIASRRSLSSSTQSTGYQQVNHVFVPR
jgi:hypothetical protein